MRVHSQGKQTGKEGYQQKQTHNEKPRGQERPVNTRQYKTRARTNMEMYGRITVMDLLRGGKKLSTGC